MADLNINKRQLTLKVVDVRQLTQSVVDIRQLTQSVVDMRQLTLRVVDLVHSRKLSGWGNTWKSSVNLTVLNSSPLALWAVLNTTSVTMATMFSLNSSKMW